MAKKRKYEEAFTDSANTIYNMIYNLAPSVFRWSGIPENRMPASEVFERMLLKDKCVAAFNTTVGLQVLSCTIPGVNQWGEPAEGAAVPKPKGGITFEVDRSIMPIVLWDQPSHKSIMPTLEWYIETLGKLRQAIDSCTRWLKTPIIFQGGEEQAELIYTLVQRIEAGYPAIAVQNGSFSIGQIELTPTNVSPAILDALHMSYERIEAKLFEEIGVPDYNTQKMAQQTSTEVILPMLAVALKTMSRLAMRREWADKVNATYGTNISVQALSLGLIEQSIFSSTGHIVNLQDLNNNGIPDKLEVAQSE